MEKVAFVETDDRKTGVEKALDFMGNARVKNRAVLIKPNFNTADRVPGSTHNDTLTALVDRLWDMGAGSISLGERSFPLTREVMAEKGVIPLLEKRQVEIIDFDTLAERDWVEFTPENSHWKSGFRIARPIIEAECLVTTCCLKTHQFGGVFTLSLKLSVGVVPTDRHGFSYMQELHTSPHQQEMIAEINQPFSPDIVVLDGIDAFVDQGPATGKRARGNVFLAASDRVAVDAVGVALLKHLGSNAAIMDTPIFAQRQIARAAELGLGVRSASEIELVPVDDTSRPYGSAIRKILAEAG